MYYITFNTTCPIAQMYQLQDKKFLSGVSFTFEEDMTQRRELWICTASAIFHHHGQRIPITKTPRSHASKKLVKAYAALDIMQELERYNPTPEQTPDLLSFAANEPQPTTHRTDVAEDLLVFKDDDIPFSPKPMWKLPRTNYLDKPAPPTPSRIPCVPRSTTTIRGRKRRMFEVMAAARVAEKIRREEAEREEAESAEAARKARQAAIRRANWGKTTDDLIQL